MAGIRKPRIRVGVIGLGIIGSRVAAALRAAGHQVYVWSRTPHAAPNFLGSVVEVADLCDFIQIFVSDDAALLEVTRTMAAALRPRHIVAGHATVFPTTAIETAAIVESQGARYLDTPFTGSKLAAQNNQLVYYVGGDEDTLSEARPLLEATSRKILHIGEIGQASVVKIATNMMTAVVVETLAEALAVVRGSGIDAQRFVEAMEYNASRSGTSDVKLPAMIAENFEPSFSAKHMYKDVAFALGIAEGLGIGLPATEAAAGMLYEAIERHGGDHDFSILATNYTSARDPAPEDAPAEAQAAPPPAPLSEAPAPPPVEAPVPAEPLSPADTPTPAEAPAHQAPAAESAAPPAMVGTAAAEVPPVQAAAPVDPPPAEPPVPVIPPPSAAAEQPAAARVTARQAFLRTVRDFFKPVHASH